MNDFYVYGLIDPKNDKCFYVGKGCKDRMFQHEKKVKRGATTQNLHLDRKIAKVLCENGHIKYKKFFDLLLEDDAFDMEDEKIKEIGIDNLCNIWSGGKGGRIPSDEVRKKISKNRKGIPVSDETKQKMREAKLGTKQSDETRRKKSNALRGKPQSKLQQEANSKRSDKMSGRKFTEEHKQKLREAKLKNPVKYWKDKTLPEDMKQKISDSVKQTLKENKDVNQN